MKTIVLSTVLAFGVIAPVNAVEYQAALELEPCINGAVSASGLYATQAQENHAVAVAVNGSQAKRPSIADAQSKHGISLLSR